MAAYIDPATGATQAYQASNGTTAQPFSLPMAWQPSSLSYVTLKADAGGNLFVVNGNPSITPNAPATATATSSDSVALSANASRTGLVITNVGTVNVFFGMGVAAVANSGLALAANGTWVMDRYTFYSGAIHAITASGSAALAIQEYQ